MKEKDILDFLRLHQPLPPDSDLTEEIIDTYDEIRLYLKEAPSRKALPLLLNSFGEGDGWGVYQLVEDVIAQYPSGLVAEVLVQTLRSEYSSVRYWSAQIAATVEDPRLVSPLLTLLKEDNLDNRTAALTALSQQDLTGSRVDLCEYLVDDKNPTSCCLEEALGGELLE